MSDSTPRLPARPSLEQLQKQAKQLLRRFHAGDSAALERFRSQGHRSNEATQRRRATLADAQRVIAREYGFESWARLKHHIEVLRPAGMESYERLASDLVSAHDSHDQAALQRLNEYYQRSFTFDDLGAEIWRRVYSFRQRTSNNAKNCLEIVEAQILVAQDAGFGSWEALAQAIAARAAPIAPHAIDKLASSLAPRRRLSDKEWDEAIGVMKEHRLSALEANGLMTDAVLARVAELEHVTALSLGGSRQLTDEGLQHLARMPQLQTLELNEYPGGKLTDRGLEVLRHLPNLEVFAMTWQRGVTDAGVGNLRFCSQLERVNLMGSPTGDGAIEALQGKPRLRQFSSGRLVTDAGLRLLHNFPMLKQWHGGEMPLDARGSTAATRLLIDGPFTNQGLASLAGLEGVFELDLFWHVTGITSDGFAHLVNLPHLSALGADGKLSDDVAMGYIAAMPSLRRLRAQGTVATDDGFEALSRSRTIARIWGGRDCINLGSRGFRALAKMPALRELGVSCKNVDDEALSTLARFPALEALTPIDVSDEGFRHIGRCSRLERLSCMYCRDTTDVATEYVAGLPLTFYYAGLTQITDRSLQVLGQMPTLEQVEFYECKGVTNAGLVFLADLPRLREVHLSGLPAVTLQGTQVFPGNVRVQYST